ncbi:hypothetical protein [Streptomyces sp. NPDC097981]
MVKIKYAVRTGLSLVPLKECFLAPWASGSWWRPLRRREGSE